MWSFIRFLLTTYDTIAGKIIKSPVGKVLKTVKKPIALVLKPTTIVKNKLGANLGKKIRDKLINNLIKNINPDAKWVIRRITGTKRPYNKQKPKDETVVSYFGPQDLAEKLLVKASLYESIKEGAREINANLVRVKIDFNTALLDRLTSENIVRYDKEELEMYNAAIDKELINMGLDVENINALIDANNNKNKNEPIFNDETIKEMVESYSYDEYMSSWEYKFLNSDDESLPADLEDRKKLWEEIAQGRDLSWYRERRSNYEKSKNEKLEEYKNSRRAKVKA